MIYGEDDFNTTLIKIIKDGYRHSCYEEACRHAEEMSWHLYGVTPTELLERVRPNEPPEVTNYRMDNYEPKTKSSADKAINIVSKIFNENLYSIRWKDKNESAVELAEYTLEYYPKNNSVINFEKDVALRKMLADPNAVEVVKLERIPTKQTEKLRPIIVLYGSKNVYNYDLDHYLIWIKDEQEKAASGGTITWRYFEYYDANQYVNFKSYVTSTGALVTEEQESYVYNFGEIPVWELQGVTEAKDNGDTIYKSFFSAAVPFWNDSITHESDVKASFIGHIFPQKYELSEPCNYRFQWEGMQFPCKGGTIKYGKEERGDTMSCPSCSGSGYRNMAGPYGVYKISKEKLTEGDTPTGIDPVGYITVPVDATKMLEERAENQRRLGMWAINMDVEDEIGQNQSGIAKVIDRSAQYDTLGNIASVVFDVHLQNAYYFFNLFMFGVSDKSIGKDAEINLPEINKPTQFDIQSSAELINNFKAAKDSGLDANLLQIRQQEIITRDGGTNPDLKKFAFLLLDLDPLPGMDAQTISLNQSKGFVSKADAAIHFNLKNFIEQAIDENPDFTQKPKKYQKEILKKYGQAFVKDNEPKIDPSIMQYAQSQQKKTFANA
jgi:hypothetical protein